MAPGMLNIDDQYSKDIDIVMLNVDNIRWQDLVEEFQVNGIPQFNFFDSDGKPSGRSIGFRTEEEIKSLIDSLLKGIPLKETSNLDSKGEFSVVSLDAINPLKKEVSSKPMSHV